MLNVVVVTHNSAAHLPGLLASLEDGLAGVPDHRVVVVDNASTDETREVVSAWSRPIGLIASDRNEGYAAAINRALVHAPAGPVLVLNPDVRLAPGSVRLLLEATAQDGVGVAAPRLIGPDGRTAYSLRRDPSVARAWAEAVLGGERAARSGRSEVISDPAAYDPVSDSVARDVDWATGAVLLISQECRAQVGEWDESFFLYSEEVDWCRRARRLGWSVRYVPTAQAHHVGGDYGTDPRLWSLLMRNRSLDFSRHHSRWASMLFRLALLTGEVIRGLRPGAEAHRAGARAVMDPESVTWHREQLNASPTESASTESAPTDSVPTDRGFIWFAAQDWWYHNQAHSDFQLMRQVAAHRPVLVVNSLGLRLPTSTNSTQATRRVLRKLRSMTKTLRRPVPDLPGFHVMSPVLLPFYGEGWGARLNAWSVRQQVRLAARRIGVGARPHIGVTIPTAWPVVRTMKRASLVFNRSDLHSAFPEADGTWVEGLENALLAHADRVLYVSRALMESDGDLVGERAVFLDHGVDIEHFAPTGPIDPEVAALARPRLGFFGGIDDYVVDVDLLRRTAQDNPEASVVIVGDATCDMSSLTELPNVHWLGYRPYADIPALGRGFDVGLMPWLDNEWIQFANPIKLKEYLALGLPVVTTDYPEVADYRDRVLVAGHRDSFPSLARDAVRRPGEELVPDPAALRESVLPYSWSARADHLARVADDVFVGAPEGVR